MGLSFWIVPPESDASKLKQLMKPPQNTLLPYTLHVFDPHITLGTVPSTTPISLLRSAIPTLSEPLHISFKSLEAGEHYFRSVLIDINKTPELESLHAIVQQNLRSNAEGAEITFKSPRFPHLSLFYIPDEHAADREHIRDAFWENGLVTRRLDYDGVAFEIKGDSVARSTDVNAECLEGFETTEVWIVNCEGPTEDWKVVEKVPLVR